MRHQSLFWSTLVGFGFLMGMLSGSILEQLIQLI